MAAAIGTSVAALVGVKVGVFGATVIGTVILTGASVGASYLASALLRPQASPGLKPSDAQQALKQALSERRWSVGRVRVSGPVWWFATGGPDPWNLYLGIALNHGRIGGIVGYHIDSNEVVLDGAFQVQTAPYFGTGHRVYLLSRLGLPVETDYTQLFTAFGVADVRGDGVASVLGIFDSFGNAEEQINAYPNGIPLVRVTMDASVCFDPREPTHDREDPPTWEFSENPAVWLLTYLLHPDGFGIPWSRIEPNLAEWKAAMDICDEEIALLAGGASSLYRLAGTFKMLDRPIDIVSRTLSTCDGRLWTKRDGTLGIAVGRFVPPSVRIESRDILSYRMERGQDRLTAVAGLRATYTSPEDDYREHEAEPWPSGTTVLALGEDRVDSLDLTWVPSRTQTRRLMKREYIRRTAAWRGEITTNLAGLRAIDERYINLTIDELGLDESFEVTRWSIDPSRLTCAMEVVSVGAEIDAWDPSEEGDPDAELTLFGFVDSFTKTGTAVDPLVEAGGEIGQLALVFGAAATLAATPAGWTLVHSVGPTSGLALGAWSRVLDGTEISTTFLGGAGPIIVILIQSAPAPAYSNKDAEISTGEPNPQFVPDASSPFGVFSFAACNASKSDTAWLRFQQEGNNNFTHDEILATGAISGLVEFVLFRAEENPFGIVVYMDDEGTNGLMTFKMQPGN